MITENSEKLLAQLASSARKITAKVELYKGSTLAATYAGSDELQSILVERSGDQTKLIGFGVGQKATVKILDKNREKLIDSSYSFKIYFGTEEEDSYITSLPTFYVAEVSRDETTNAITLIGNDLLEKMKAHKMTELNTDNYEEMNNLNTTYNNIISFFNLPYGGLNVGDEYWEDELLYQNGNIFGEEATFRDVLDDIAELAYSIYYMDKDNAIRFTQKYYDEYTIDKSQYFELKAKDEIKIATVVSVNDLGDNLVVADENKVGETEYFRSNAFIEAIDYSRDEELGVSSTESLILALERVIARTPAKNPIELKWRGNPLVEIGDILVIETKDGGYVRCPLINDTIEYNGGFSQRTSWEYEKATTEEVIDSNPSSLGEALTQTFAKVNKADKEIQLLTSSVNNNEAQMAQLKLTTSEISASVSNTKQSVENMEESVSNLQQSVEAKLSADEVNIIINEAFENGVEKVSTSTGFKFDKNGLNITKENSDISTLIDEDGMDISKGSEKVLVADNQGVEAINLTAKQYLIIGDFSRFENYGENRTGCFWIGG